MATRAGDSTPQDVTVLKELMDTQCGPRSMHIIDAMAKLEGHKAALDEQEFLLLMNRLTYDVDAWRVHKHTCSDYIAAVSRQNHTWNLKRHEQAGKAANAFLKQHCLIITYGKAPTKGDDGVHELEEDTGQEPSDPRGTRVHLCFVQPGCAEHVAKQLLGVLWIMRVVHGPGPEPHGCGHASVCVH